MSRLAALLPVALLIGCAQGTPKGGPTAAPSVSAPATVLSKQATKIPERLLEAGAPAPDAQALAHTGQRVGPQSFAGVPLAVYFCRTHRDEACKALAHGVKDAWFDLTSARTMVLGATQDDRIFSRELAAEERLPFLVVDDGDGHLARSFGVKLEGGGYPSAAVAFVIGREGKILQRLDAPTPSDLASALRAAARR